MAQAIDDPLPALPAPAARRLDRRHPAPTPGIRPPHVDHRHGLARRVRHSPAPRRARADLVTTAEGAPVVVGEAEMLVTIGANRTVESVETVPHRDGIDQLVGTQGGSYLRSAIETALPGEREAATPLHLLLDDVAGTSLIGGFAWSRWTPEARAAMNRPMPAEFGLRKGRIICSGLRPGGSAQTARDDRRGAGARDPTRRRSAGRRRSARVARVPRATSCLHAPSSPGRRPPRG